MMIENTIGIRIDFPIYSMMMPAKSPIDCIETLIDGDRIVIGLGNFYRECYPTNMMISEYSIVTL